MNFEMLPNELLCCGCTACQTVCPTQAIAFVANEEGFLYPRGDAQKCINCGECVRVCPLITLPALRSEPRAYYAARAKDEDVLMTSSSGGVFTSLAENCLKQEGVVYGCALVGEDLEVRHIRIDQLEALPRLRGSKYVQSNLEGIYAAVRQDLKQGRAVLFSGTPCQVAGLYASLQDASVESLTTVDFICHGVPSPMVYRRYCQALTRKLGPLSEILFRAKIPSWFLFSLHVTTKRGETQTLTRKQDPYLKAFLADYSLRRGCFECKMKGGLSGADITLADGWGLANSKVFDREKGCSSVILNSSKGSALWTAVQEHFDIERMTYEDVLRGNKYYVEKVALPPRRAAFFKYLKRYSVRTAFWAAKHNLAYAFFKWIIGK